ncbi:MAG: MBL fold metallo-hydrolase [Clostridia bacterium]|nr:MBL fold metallo-hydrolase [Clostridia bacterium]
MRVVKIYPKRFASNSYLVTADGVNAIAIDPSEPRVLDEAARAGLDVGLVLLTHGHFDHVGGVAAFKQRGAKVLCSKEEEPLVGTEAVLLGYGEEERFHFSIDGTLSDAEGVDWFGLHIRCILTAGHTAGSACYLVSDAKDGGRALFTGDTLFFGTVGRTDLPTGDGGLLMESLKKLAALEGDYPVYAGHDEDTTLEEERRSNPFLIGR